jgi:MFS family permease
MSDQIKGPGGVSDQPVGGAGTLSLPLSPPPANAHWLLWAGFMAILASGIGFAIRGGIISAWGSQYGLTNTEIGTILGAGLTGFCFGIIIGGIVADKVGYGWLVAVAFLLHIVSAVITFLASDSILAGTDVTLSAEKQSTFLALYWGMFIFSLANGVLEAVANPLVATLFPENRTHYLNILHASWPAGLVLGSVCGWVLGEQYNVYWKDQLALYLIPTLLYGVMFLGQSMPQSEAAKQGLSLGDMFKDVGILGGLVVCALLAQFLTNDILQPMLQPSPKAELDDATRAVLMDRAGLVSKGVGYGVGALLLLVIAFVTNFSIGSPLLFFLFIAHALVGAVELGTDSWITNITGNLLTSSDGRILFAYASAIMFLLRFCSDFIEKRLGLSPVAILFTCSVLACCGLLLASRIDTFLFALLAIGVYAVGKTFFWPTMLAVASDRFPRTGAVAISMMGGIGMLSAGLIGGPGLGFAKDRFSGEALERSASEAVVKAYKSEKPGKWLFLPEAAGIDPGKLGTIQDKNKRIKNPEKKSEADNTPFSVVFKVEPRKTEVKKETTKGEEKLTETERTVLDASIEGDRMTLVADAAIPATMAVIYLGMLIYFWAIGGYKVLHIDGTEKEKSGH